MSRPQVLVRRIDSSQTPSLAPLWLAQRVESGTSAEAAERALSEGTLEQALARPEVVAFLATTDAGEAVGYAVLTDTTGAVFSDAPSVGLDQLFVATAWRRHGVARHLLSAAATYADRSGAEQIVGHVPAGQRDANRFFARLGFTPTTVRRVTTPAALQRRLAAATSGAVSRAPLGSLEQVLLRRRSARGRALREAAGAR
ncbi:GNAT family N-acetyltransferase [Lapillicoccus jejuensis]|uniref:Ribosomal protein S18 acetylase RimI-like enzyme n=1 Tax=Lapillicoccus jejuensis TaxID=402171 RepID=A0A542E459_9MICO|nr:GNAT family N-acetyltransferase [Lapillicoccus jejuensis]TQJ10079.1 ribosomal protein S18 acetylase RimI-like enzyme [Lapillicoccus jejuensis]